MKVQEPEAYSGEVNLAFKEPVHRIIDKIKHEPYFWWPHRMGGDLARRNQNLYCTYHKDKGHTTEQYLVLRDHLAQLAMAGHLKDFVVDAGETDARQGTQQRGNPLPPPLGIIEVIHAHPRGFSGEQRNEVLTMTSAGSSSDEQPSGKRMKVA